VIERRTINGVSLLYSLLDPVSHDIRAAYKPGSTIKEIGQAEGADIALNFNYADDDFGYPIGRLIVDGKTVVNDIPKTVARDELYMLPDGSLHIGKAPANAVWAIQGSPPLLRHGAAVQDGIKRDQLGKDVWSRVAIRTAVGLRSNRELVIVRTLKEVFLPQLTTIMLELGCVDALNGDGGGSSYMWPENSGWGRKLGSALIAKRREHIKMKLIALCDGHGMETPGKRTPTLPDGTFMHENDFNRAVVAKLDVHLKRCGFNTLLVAAGDTDVPLKTRTDAANNANADFYISVHANAIGAGEWNGTRGIETFHYSQASEVCKKAAAIIHRYLISGTKLPDRGVKSADFHVLRETKMPAVLAECAFMTNHEDANLLLTDAYRSECAEELARGLCEYFGFSFAREVVLPPVEKPLPAIKRTVKGRLNDQRVKTDGYFIEGKTYVPLRELAEALGAKVEWNNESFEYHLKTKGK